MKSKNKVYRAIGLMSGTSMDGMDAAFIETNGLNYVDPIRFVTHPYKDEFRERLRALLGTRERTKESLYVEAELTLRHAAIVREILKAENLSPEQIDVIGFHGHTITHDPKNKFTWQLGNGEILSKELGISVVSDLRKNDIEHGGQGAPLLPIYHRVLTSKNKIDRYVAFLNIGGVSNLTFIDMNQEDMIAFDCGPGNALLDDFILKRTGKHYDEDGAIAMKGKPDMALVKKWIKHPYFKMKPPKSLDRQEWDVSGVDKLSTEDGAATLAQFTVESIKAALKLLPNKPGQTYVCGGGRHNKYFFHKLNVGSVFFRKVEMLGWNGDAIEAQGFAYLAIRSLKGLPITYPGTTGTSKPISGGILHEIKTEKMPWEI